MRKSISEVDARRYLQRALIVLNAFAGEGICMEGFEEPELILCDLVSLLDVNDWDEVIEMVLNTPGEQAMSDISLNDLDDLEATLSKAAPGTWDAMNCPW